jgi:hypothetical protein
MWVYVYNYICVWRKADAGMTSGVVVAPLLLGIERCIDLFMNIICSHIIIFILLIYPFYDTLIP